MIKSPNHLVRVFLMFVMEHDRESAPFGFVFAGGVQAVVGESAVRAGQTLGSGRPDRFEWGRL